nr:hypothetical protein [Acetobacter syzygii]
MTDQKPTGVFIRLPLSGEEASTMRDHIMSQILTTDALEHTLHAIGTPITGGKLKIVGYAPSHLEGGLCAIFRKKSDALKSSIPLARQSDAQAKIAALEAEVVRLREALDASKRKNFNAGYLIACCNIYNMHNEEGIAADILREAGIAEAEVKALDLNEYDAEALAAIRGAGNDDPILKGGAA